MAIVETNMHIMVAAKDDEDRKNRTWLILWNLQRENILPKKLVLQYVCSFHQVLALILKKIVASLPPLQPPVNF